MTPQPDLANALKNALAAYEAAKAEADEHLADYGWQANYTAQLRATADSAIAAQQERIRELEAALRDVVKLIDDEELLHELSALANPDSHFYDSGYSWHAQKAAAEELPRYTRAVTVVDAARKATAQADGSEGVTE